MYRRSPRRTLSTRPGEWTWAGRAGGATKERTNVGDLAIRLRDVAKSFGPIRAVDGLDLDVPEGTCVGLLGPNGAGESTTMKMLTAQAIADRGEIEVLGYTLPRQSKSARAEMGVVPQLDNLDTTLTVQQNLIVFSYRSPVRSCTAPGCS